MKKFLMVSFSLLMVVLVSACQKEVKGYTYDFSKDIKEPTTITVWIDDSEGFMMEEMVKEFNKLHPDILVEWAHMGTVDAMNQLQLSGPSGNGADIFQFPHDQLATALRHQLLYDLPEADVAEIEERALETAMQVATACYNPDAANKGQNAFDCSAEGSERKVFAVPISVESVALFYNKDLVDKPAETWEELLEEANKAEGNNFYFNTNWNDSYFINFILSAHGYQPFGENMDDPDAINLNSPEVIAALQWILDNIVPYYGTGTNAPAIQAIAHTDFENGKTPYLITGPWMIETYKGIDDLNFGVTKIPTININGKDVEPKPFLGAQMLGIYKGTSKFEAALKFIKFWQSDKGLEIQYKHKGKLPALKEEYLENIPGVKDDEYLQGISAQLENTIPMPTISEVEYYWEPVREMINDVWSNGYSPADAARRAENNYNQRRGMSE